MEIELNNINRQRIVGLGPMDTETTEVLWSLGKFIYHRMITDRSLYFI